MKLKYLVLLIALLMSGVAYGADAEQGQAIGAKSMIMPTENADGSTLTDLAQARLLWAFTTMGYDKATRSVLKDATTEGATESVPFVISLTGSIGDVITIFFVGTAIDDKGNESVFGFKADGTESVDQFVIVDNIGPAPPTMVLDFHYILDIHDENGNRLSAVPLA